MDSLIRQHRGFSFGCFPHVLLLLCFVFCARLFVKLFLVHATHVGDRSHSISSAWPAVVHMGRAVDQSFFGACAHEIALFKTHQISILHIFARGYSNTCPLTVSYRFLNTPRFFHFYICLSLSIILLVIATMAKIVQFPPCFCQILPKSRSAKLPAKLPNFFQGNVQILFPGPESLDVAVPVTFAVAGHVPKHVPEHVAQRGPKLLESTKCFQHGWLNLRGGRVDLFNGCLQWEESGRWIKVIYIYIYPNEIA